MTPCLWAYKNIPFLKLKVSLQLTQKLSQFEKRMFPRVMNVLTRGATNIRPDRVKMPKFGFLPILFLDSGEY